MGPSKQVLNMLKGLKKNKPNKKLVVLKRSREDLLELIHTYLK